MAAPFFPESRKGYTEVRSTNGKPSTNIFLRFTETKPAGAPKKSKVVPANLKVKEAKLTGRGASAFQLYLTCHIDPKDDNRYDFTVTQAEVDSMIWVMPKHEFDTLADFAPVYESFAATAGYDKLWEEATDKKAMWASYEKNWRKTADQFAEAHVGTEKGHQAPDGTAQGTHWATTFTGLRAKTVRHELDHVRFAVEGCDGLVGNFVDEVRKAGKSSNGGTPRERVDKWVDALMGQFGFPYFDVGGKEHKKIAKRDCFFMVAWYQRHELEMPILDLAPLEAELAAIYDPQLSAAMKQLGESFPWL